MNEEIKLFHIMVIMPNGVVTDVDATESPRTGQYFSILGRSYRVLECHESAHENWTHCATLGN